MVKTLVKLIRTLAAVMALLSGIPLAFQRVTGRLKEVAVQGEGANRRGTLVVNPDKPQECEQRGEFCSRCPFSGECLDPYEPGRDSVFYDR